MPTANWSVISHGKRIIHDIIHINTYIRVSSQPIRQAGSKRISFITEGLPWKITVNSWSIQKKQWERRKKERERRSRQTRTMLTTQVYMHAGHSRGITTNERYNSVHATAGKLGDIIFHLAILWVVTASVQSSGLGNVQHLPSCQKTFIQHMHSA